MKITVDGRTYQVFIARLKAPQDFEPDGSADVKVLGPDNKEYWYEFETAGLYDPDTGNLYSAAEDFLAKKAVEECIEEVKAEGKAAEGKKK